MPGLLSKSYPFDFGLRKRLIMATWVGIGIFLFILFFQPFDIRQTDLNNYILLIAGFGGIAFLLQILIHLILPIRNLSFRLDQYNLNTLLAFELLIWILNSVAFSFYLRYVGKVPLTFFLVFKLVMVSLLLPVVNMLIYELHDLKLKLAIANQKESDYLSSSDSKSGDQNIEFASTTRSERLKIKLNELILIKSAENYVEIHYRDGLTVQKKLLRTTLRNIEDQFINYPSLIRCHRNCIINTSQVLKLKRTPAGFRLLVKDYEDEVIVSRQHLLQVRNIVENDQ